MKRILAVMLAVLMLMPTLASLVIADGIALPDDTPTKNIAGEAEISIEDTNGMNVSVGDADLSYVIDGDKATGTVAPNGKSYSYLLEFDEVKYFTEIVVACNGSGELSNGLFIENDKYNITKLRVTVYDGEEITYQSIIEDVSQLKELVVKPEAKGNKIQVYKVAGNDTTNYKDDYMWEIEAYAPDMQLCDARESNIAADAVFTATGANNNNFWATRWNALTDGDPLTGTHSPQGRNYSIWMTYSEEHLFSEIEIVCNTDGGAKLLGTGTVLEDRTYNVGMMQVLVYNYNEDVVWDSDLLDTSTVASFSLSPYVKGAIIEMRILNGGFGGGEYLYEVSAYEQTGDHVFTQVAEENPTCLLPGIRQLACHCGKEIKQSVPATGFHKWTKGEITKTASDTENGVLSLGCETCDSVKLRDVPAIGHNWDNGVTVPPACEQEGYVLHKCTDAGCELTYKSDYTDALVHIWDEGKITVFPTVETEGVYTYTCSVCNGTKNSRIRKHKYSDNTFDLTRDNVKSITQITTEGFTGMDPNSVFDGKVNTSWYSPTGSQVVIELDREYVFTSGYLYLSSNWTDYKVDFITDNPNFDPSKPEDDKENPKLLVVTHYQNDVDNGANAANPLKFDLVATLNVGAKAKKIVITLLEAKWPNGSATRVHEIELKAHRCVVSEVDYLTDPEDGYVAPNCGIDGSCKAKCQVCGLLNDVVIKATPDVGHDFELKDVIVDVEATCSASGTGHVVCKKCNRTVENVTIPSTGEHDFSVNKVVVSAKCAFAGVGNKVCKYCDKVGSTYEIAPTGEHIREWSVDSQAAYTAVGKTVYACIYCDDVSENDPETGINTIVADRIEIPSDILTFVGASKDNGALSLKYKIKLEYLAEIEKTCDVRVITTIKDSLDREATIESYGKYATNSYDATTGEFTITFYPKALKDEFQVNTVIRLMNFRGVVYKVCSMGSYGTSISLSVVK